MVLGIQPLLYGAYIHENLISEQKLGTLAAAEISAIALGSTIGVALLKYRTVQTVGILGIAILIAGNLLPSVIPLFLTRALAGIGSGLIVALAAARIAEQTNVNAASGLFLFLQATSQYAIMQGFSLAAPEASAASMQTVLSLIALSSTPLLLLMPSHHPIPQPTADGGPPPIAGWVALATCGLYLGAAIGVWAYLGIWLESSGMQQETVTPMVTASLAGQMVGALVAVVIGTHSRSDLQVIASGAVMTAAVFMLILLGPEGLTGWLLLIGFGFAWMVGTPALSGLVLKSDPQRKSLPYTASAQLLGAAVIPTVLGELLSHHGLSMVLAASAGLIAVAIILVPAASPAKHGLKARPD